MTVGIIFSFSSLVFFVLLLVFVPKHLTKQEFYSTFFVMIALTLISDLTFGHLFDMYDFFKDEITFTDLFLQLTLPPTIGVLILNFMPLQTARFIYYWIAITILSLLYEWLSVITGYLVYKGWIILYSVPFYSLGLLYLRWHLFFLRGQTSSNR